MGNQTSGASGGIGGTSTDVVKQYTVESEPIDVGEDYGGFTLLRGKRKRDNLPVLVLRCEKAKTTSAGICSNALRQAKKLRHPLILNLLDGTETDSDIFMVLEDSTPLAVVLRRGGMSNAQRCWGLRCLASALAFVNEKLRLVHGNVTPYTVFVTPGGDWKLFGFELLDMECVTKGEGAELPPLLKQAQWIPTSQYKSPERRKNEWTQMASSNVWSLDSWGLGMIVLDSFDFAANSRIRTPGDVGRDVDRLVENASFRANVKQLLNADPKARLSPSALLRSDYFSDMFVKCTLFLEELQLKAPEKKELFFDSFVQNCAAFPPGALQYKIIPLLAQAISFESKAVNDKNVAAASGQAPPSPSSVKILLGMLDSLLLCDQTVRSANPSLTASAHVDTSIVDLFACNDRVVRVGLLERISKIAKASFSDSALNNCFDQIATGFGDSTPKIRELTIKAMMPLAPKLNDLNKNDKLLRHIARLQMDQVPELRANSAVLLTAIAPLLSADARRKTLTASFARAMKDAYVPARTGGLRGLISTHKLMGLDANTLASKILPTICPMLVDPHAEVRALAFEAMNALLKTLQEEIKAVDDKQAAAAAAMMAGGSGGGGGGALAQESSSGMLGMAVNFFTSAAKPASAQPPPPQQQHQQAYVPPPVTAVSKPPHHIGGNWEDDDEDDMMGGEEDPDDFFSKPAAQQQKRAAPAAVRNKEPVFDAFANETKLQQPSVSYARAPVAASRSNDFMNDDDYANDFPSSAALPSASKPPASSDARKMKELSAADLDLFTFDAPLPAASKPAASARPPTRTVRTKPMASASSSTATTTTTAAAAKPPVADDDFFNSLISTAPPPSNISKRKA